MKNLDTMSAWDFELPPDRIASTPLAARPDSRLLVLAEDGRRHDHAFTELQSFLRAGDILVFNDTKVLPARLEARRKTGAKVELLVVGGSQEGVWDDTPQITAMLRSNRRVQIGEALLFSDDDDSPTATLVARGEDGLATLTLTTPRSSLLARYGRLPLPPYIEDQRRARGQAVVQSLDTERYQSVLAEHEGAIAAPTASLHFDDALLDRVRAQGVEIARVTLHVGIGTFRPVRGESLSEHAMHVEHCELRPEVAAQLNDARTRGGRVIAIGTTVVRTLESLVDDDGRFLPGACATDIFIRPGYRFRGVDAMLTNFHLPKSTLLALVAAFAGYEATMSAYAHAIADGYRFFSYGDAMLLLTAAPSARSEVPG